MSLISVVVNWNVQRNSLAMLKNLNSWINQLTSGTCKEMKENFMIWFLINKGLQVERSRWHRQETVSAAFIGKQKRKIITLDYGSTTNTNRKSGKRNPLAAGVSDAAGRPQRQHAVELQQRGGGKKKKEKKSTVENIHYSCCGNKMISWKFGSWLLRLKQ